MRHVFKASVLSASVFCSAVVGGCVGDTPVLTNPTDAGTSDTSQPPADGATCSAPKTQCTKGSQTICTDTTSDDANCGKCNNACPTAASCKSSACTCTDATKNYCEKNGTGACVDFKSDAANCGSCGTTCFDGKCNNGACAKIVFVTSATNYASLSFTDAIAYADLTCNNLAGGVKLPGTYMAWLSTSTSSPAARFKTKSPGGYVRPDKVLVAASWADFINPAKNLLAPINVTEALSPVSASARAATATTRAGTLSGTGKSLTCDDWSQSASSAPAGQGNPSATTSEWTDMSSTGNCILPNSYVLYCFEQ